MITSLRATWIVFCKEVIENLRDRRAMFSAFLIVPLMGPLLFAGMTIFMVERVVGEADERLRFPVIGAEHAPNLMQFLTEHDVDLVLFTQDPDEARAAVRESREHFVVVIPESLGARIKAGETAPLEVIWDSSNNKAQRHASRARRLLDAYSVQLGKIRLLARGIDPQVVDAFDVRSVDIATPSGRSLVLLGTLTYFLIFSLLMGGIALAIDVTAGERERGSLESLLSVPVARANLVLGKIGATVLFMLMALSLTLTALIVSMQFMPLEKLGMSSNFGPWVGLKIAVILLPMSIFGAALLFIVGSFTRTYREAQTWLGAVLAIPTLPILFAGMANVRPSTSLMTVPSLSQHLIATNLLRGDALNPVHVIVSIGSTLLIGIVLVAIATRLYHRERLLG